MSEYKKLPYPEIASQGRQQPRVRGTASLVSQLDLNAQTLVVNDSDTPEGFYLRRFALCAAKWGVAAMRTPKGVPEHIMRVAEESRISLAMFKNDILPSQGPRLVAHTQRMFSECARRHDVEGMTLTLVRHAHELVHATTVPGSPDGLYRVGREVLEGSTPGGPINIGLDMLNLAWQIARQALELFNSRRYWRVPAVARAKEVAKYLAAAFEELRDHPPTHDGENAVCSEMLADVLGTDRHNQSAYVLTAQQQGRGDGWGRTTLIEGLPMPERVVTRLGRKSTPSDIGMAITYAERECTDGQIFGRTYPRKGGTVLFDVSGSMQYSDSEFDRAINAAPAVTMAAYSGSDYSGNVCVIARKGRRIEGFSAIDGYMHGGNTVDLPALEWLAKQRGPRIWVSDGKVYGAGCLTLAMIHQVQDICRDAKIVRIPDCDAMVDYLRGKRNFGDAALYQCSDVVLEEQATDA